MVPCPSLDLGARRLGPLLLALSLLTGAAACREGDRTAGSAAASTAGSADASGQLRRYTVRAEIVSLPGGPTGARQLSLRHEAIDDFVDSSGKAVGMGSMVMPFDLAPGVALDELRAGDKVEALIAVGWSPSLLQVERLRKLPPETALELRSARPPSGARP